MSRKRPQQTDAGSLPLVADGAGVVTVSTGGVERMRIDNAGLITGTGTSLGAWTTFSPTLGTGSWAIGNGTITARYCKVGKTVSFIVIITFGSTSAYDATFSPTITPPFTVPASADFTGQARFVDASTGTQYLGLWRVSGTNAFTLNKTGANGVIEDVTSTVPFSWTTSDVIYISGTYEAA